MTITDDLREEAKFTLSKYASLDMNSTHNKQQFCKDLFHLLSQWQQQGYYVNCDGRKDVMFAGMNMDSSGELFMCYQQL